jgi:hypothetical protein
VPEILERMHFRLWHFSEVPPAASEGRSWLHSGHQQTARGAFMSSRPRASMRIHSGYQRPRRYCSRSSAGCGSSPSCSKTWPRSRQSIQPPQAGHRMRRSASATSTGLPILGSIGRPIYFPRGIVGRSAAISPQPSGLRVAPTGLGEPTTQIFRSRSGQRDPHSLSKAKPEAVAP